MVVLFRIAGRRWRRFVSTIGSIYAGVLQTVQFNLAVGRVSVQPQDFGRVAKIEARLQWLKVVVLLYQYIGQTPKQREVDDTDPMTRSVFKVPSLVPEVIDEISEMAT